MTFHTWYHFHLISLSLARARWLTPDGRMAIWAFRNRLNQFGRNFFRGEIYGVWGSIQILKDFQSFFCCQLKCVISGISLSFLIRTLMNVYHLIKPLDWPPKPLLKSKIKFSSRSLNFWTPPRPLGKSPKSPDFSLKACSNREKKLISECVSYSTTQTITGFVLIAASG